MTIKYIKVDLLSLLALVAFGIYLVVGIIASL